MEETNNQDIDMDEELDLDRDSVKENGSPKMFPIFLKNHKPKKDPLMTLHAGMKRTSTLKNKGKLLLSKKDPEGFVQTVIDAGQKKLGPLMCDQCNLLYSPGDYEDEKMHRRLHSKLDDLHVIKLWPNPDIMMTYADSSYVISVDLRRENGKIINKLKSFVGWIDSELGGGYLDYKKHKSRKLFLCLIPTKKHGSARVLGCVVIEVLDTKKILVSPINDETASSPNSQLIIGITRLWTDPVYRKRHVATKLCDIMRFNTGIPGIIVKKNQLAILEPTEDGKQFMNKYSEGASFIYTYKLSG